MGTRNRTFLFSALIGVAVVFLVEGARANFEFSPITAQLTTDGKTSSLLAKVVNKASTETPIVIRVMERTMQEDGEEVRAPSSDLEVYPSQFILAPKESKFIKINWKGAKDLPYEKAFRILVDHVPVELAPSKYGIGSLRIMVNYSAMIYVSSKSGNPDVVLNSVQKASSKRKLTIELENKGEVHSVLTDPQISITCDGLAKSKVSEVVLKKPVLAKVDGKNLLAHSKFKTTVNVPETLEQCSNFKWNFRYAIQ